MYRHTNMGILISKRPSYLYDRNVILWKTVLTLKRYTYSYHDKDDVPDEEAWSARGCAGYGEGRVLMSRGLVGIRGYPLPGVDVFVKVPLLLVHKRLHVDRGDLGLVCIQVQLQLATVGR